MREHIRNHNHSSGRVIQLVLSLSIGLGGACIDASEFVAEDDWSVVYGNDDRVDVGAHSDMGLREMADSVALITHRADVTVDPDTGAVTLATQSLSDSVDDVYGTPLCAGEAFASDPDAGWCTSFLFSPTRMATAGHCFKKGTATEAELAQKCSDIAVVFDWQRDPSGVMQVPDADDVFYCSQVITHFFDSSGADYAVFELDRDTGRPGLPVDDSPTVQVGDPMVVIGHPNGIPKKIDDGGEVHHLDPGDEFFGLTSDTFHGNSGSPVIDDASRRVVGILVRGESDYVYDAQEQCMRVDTLPESGAPDGRAEEATSIDDLGRFLDVSEPNDSMSEALDNPVILRPAQSGSTTYRLLQLRQGHGDIALHHIGSNDSDWFTIPTYGGDQVDVRIDFVHASGDLDLELFDQSGGFLDLSNGTSDSETVSVTVPGVGGAMIAARVYGFSGAQNRYSITIDVRPEQRDVDLDGIADAMVTCGGPANVACPWVLDAGTNYLHPAHCNPRPGRVALPEDGEEIDISRNVGVCEPDNWGHRVYLGMATDNPYANNASYNWRVGLPDNARYVSLYLDRFDTESGFDFLELTNGTPHSGQAQYPTYPDNPAWTLIDNHVKRNALYLEFTSDSTVTRSGFNIYAFDWMN